MKRILAAPFVVTLSVSGCAHGDGDVKPPPPAPTPMPTTTATTIATASATATIAAPPTATAAASASPPDGLVFDGYSGCYRMVDGNRTYADCPEELLPVADKGRLTFKYGGECKTAPDGKRVRCPPDGPTVTLPEPAGINNSGLYTSLQIGTLHCIQSVHVTCPPHISCNPPAPRTVLCPPELLPKLRSGVAPTRREGDKCFYDTIEVACSSK